MESVNEAFSVSRRLFSFVSPGTVLSLLFKSLHYIPRIKRAPLVSLERLATHLTHNNDMIILSE